ncbi:Na+/H+ antiporter subunit D [Paenibacillus polymyxa]|uniref:Na+/H+ antiporter subunit D n=1 Tax=Paenibacillus TaxID=44249 RepID=UPI00077C6BF6|nr:Na+/H+ antiporter subunit D [Paenibacillus polymyxa]AOK92533.1 Na+/H+ antiporter subunit D [Paenibacillus polymyxa]KYG94462.1 Na+/H+ antiporter subunit D [Paenibacillus polymyxa]
MSNLLALPILIPLCTAVILIFLKEKILLQRFISTVSAILNIMIALVLIYRVHSEGIQTLQMGGWVPPYGIVFVGDMFAALLVLTASVVSLGILLYSFRNIGAERERFYYYTFFHFLLVGVYGSFLTGDMFNLFVFFEVMLISSYALISLGGTKLQLRETSKYLLINIVSSTLFVAAVAYLYAAVGTLNMAHLSQRVAEAGQGGVLNVIAVLFLIVFALKAGLFLFFWLPGSYSAPPSAIRALFGALLTKVGLYAIIRTFTLIFVNDPGLTHTWIAWLAAATMILGGLGAVAYNDIPRIFNYNVIISVGFVAFGLAAATPDALNGAVFYLLHDMLAKGLMFILGGIIITAAGTDQLKDMGGLIKRYPLIGWMFFILALALVGIPPLSGFAGKVLITRGGLDAGMLTLSLIGLGSSFLVLYSLIKVFKLAFWGNEPEGDLPKIRLKSVNAVAAGLLVLVILMGIGADWVYSYVAQAGDVLAHPALYIEAVIKE